MILLGNSIEGLHYNGENIWLATMLHNVGQTTVVVFLYIGCPIMICNLPSNPLNSKPYQRNLLIGANICNWKNSPKWLDKSDHLFLACSLIFPIQPKDFDVHERREICLCVPSLECASWMYLESWGPNACVYPNIILKQDFVNTFDHVSCVKYYHHILRSWC